jgi:hypothetical protein
MSKVYNCTIHRYVTTAESNTALKYQHHLPYMCIQTEWLLYPFCSATSLLPYLANEAVASMYFYEHFCLPVLAEHDV